MLEQEKVFLKNITDSVLSLETNTSSPRDLNKVEVHSNGLNREYTSFSDYKINHFEISLNTKNYRFTLSTYKIPIKSFFLG